MAVKNSPIKKGHTMRQEGKCGRKKGTPNKITKSVREAVQLAFDELGGADGLVKWVREDRKNKQAFYNIASKLIPLQVTGEGFGPLQIEQRNVLSNKVMEAAAAPRGNGAAGPATPSKPNGEAHGSGAEGT